MITDCFSVLTGIRRPDVMITTCSKRKQQCRRTLNYKSTKYKIQALTAERWTAGDWSFRVRDKRQKPETIITIIGIS